MSKTTPKPSGQTEQRVPTFPWYRDPALWIGGAAVLSFSFTFPAIHEAEPVLGSVMVGAGRILIAAVLALIVLLIRREPLPPRRVWGRLGLIAGGAIIGFPLFSALALERATVAHGAILTGMLPAATASYTMLRTRQWPSLLFRLSCVAGMLTTLSFAFVQGAGHLQVEDGWMLLAVVVGAVGYAEGGYLTRKLGAWRVICWALVIAAPLLVLPVAWSLLQHRPQISDPRVWLSLLYISLGSLFCGLIAWYAALARGGVARISQLQLCQPLLIIGWAALFLGERLTLLTGLAAALVVLCVCVAVSQQAARGKRRLDATDMALSSVALPNESELSQVREPAASEQSRRQPPAEA